MQHWIICRPYGTGGLGGWFNFYLYFMPNGIIPFNKMLEMIKIQCNIFFSGHKIIFIRTTMIYLIELETVVDRVAKRSWVKKSNFQKRKVYRTKNGKLPTSHRYDHLPLLRSCPGGFNRSWLCRTCRCKDKAFWGFCKYFHISILINTLQKNNC